MFLLDGDGRYLETRLKEDAHKLGPISPTIIFLPGTQPPEVWIWECLVAYPGEYAEAFGVTKISLDEQIRKLTSLFDATADKNRIKDRFYALCTDFLNREESEVSRVVGRLEAQRGKLFEVTQALEGAVHNWRNQRDL